MNKSSPCGNLFCIVCICLCLSSLKSETLRDPHGNLSSIDALRWDYLGLSTALLISGTLLGAGVLYLLPESITKWDKKEIRKHLGRNYLANIKKGPIIDQDQWWINWIAHPYWGAVYYLQARRSNFTPMASLLYNLLCSTLFWEYGFEAFAEAPSLQDLIITPILGSLLGELFFLGVLHIQSNDSKLLNSRFLGGLVLLLLDPIGFIINDLRVGEMVGIQNRQNFYSSYQIKNGGLTLMMGYRW